jgi:hypothetical protein
MNERMLERVEENMREFVENQARRTASQPKLARCGQCHYCSEDVKGDKLFCSSECAADYEYEQKTLRAQGRK